MQWYVTLLPNYFPLEYCTYKIPLNLRYFHGCSKVRNYQMWLFPVKNQNWSKSATFFVGKKPGTSNSVFSSFSCAFFFPLVMLKHFLMVSHYLITFFIQCILVTLQLLQRFSITKSKKRIKHHTDIQHFFHVSLPQITRYSMWQSKLEVKRYTPPYMSCLYSPGVKQLIKELIHPIRILHNFLFSSSSVELYPSILVPSETSIFYSSCNYI